MPARTPSTTSRPAESSRSRPISCASAPSRPRVRTGVPVAASATRATTGADFPLRSSSVAGPHSNMGSTSRNVSSPDEHGPRLAERLQPGRRVHRIAEGGVFDAATRADRAHDHRPRLHADADAESRHAPGCLDLAGVVGDLVNELQRRAHRTLGVVLVGGRSAEQREDAVPREVLDRSLRTPRPRRSCARWRRRRSPSALRDRDVRRERSSPPDRRRPP